MGEARSLLAALKLDEKPFVNQFMLIEEHDIADGSFVISALIEHFSKKNHHIILILCHNSLGHFQALSRKLGYNLMSLVESGQAYVINILDKIVKQNFYSAKTPLKDLYDDVKRQIIDWGDDKNVCIMVENLSNLIFVKADEMLAFVGYLRVIALERKNSSVVCTAHYFENCSEFGFILKSLRFFADLNVTLRSLKSGIANDVTGYLIVKNKVNKYIQVSSAYHYKLEDKSIKIVPVFNLPDYHTVKQTK